MFYVLTLETIILGLIPKAMTEEKYLLYLEHMLARFTWTFLEGILHSRWHKEVYLHQIMYINQVVSIIGSTLSIYSHF